MLGRSCILERFSWVEAEDVIVAYAGAFTWDFVYDPNSASGIYSCLCLRYADPLLFLEAEIGPGRRTRCETWRVGYIVDEGGYPLPTTLSISLLQQGYG